MPDWWKVQLALVAQNPSSFDKLFPNCNNPDDDGTTAGHWKHFVKNLTFGPTQHQHMFWTFGSLAPAASSLADICRVVSFAVKTRVMGHFVEFNCAGRIQCVVSEWFACTDSANSPKLWKRQFLGGRPETEIVYFVNVIDAKLQKAATILLAGPPSLGSDKSTNPSLWTSCQCENKCSRKMLLFGRREGFEKLLLLGPTFLLLRPKSWSVRP